MKRLKKKHWIIIALALIVMAIPFYALKVEPRWLMVRTIKVSERPTLRIVHLSDLHYKGDVEWLKKIVARTNDLNPQIVCITGDFVEASADLPTVLAVLGDLSAPVLAVKGNHEKWAGADLAALRDFCQSTGGDLLDNEELEIMGVHVYGASDVGEAKPIEGEKRILLCHYPAIADNLNGHRYDLILAGHTHGGQIRLPFLGALVTPYNSGAYEKGLYFLTEGVLHVSPGIGTLTPNVRFLCRPEVTLILF